MVRVRVLPVRGKEVARPDLPEHGRKAPPGFEVRHEGAVAQPQVAAPVQTQHGRGRLGFAPADFRAAVRRWLAVGQVQNAHATALRLENEDGPSHAQFGVVGVRGDDQVVDGKHEVVRCRADADEVAGLLARRARPFAACHLAFRRVALYHS